MSLVKCWNDHNAALLFEKHNTSIKLIKIGKKCLYYNWNDNKKLWMICTNDVYIDIIKNTLIEVLQNLTKYENINIMNIDTAKNLIANKNHLANIKKLIELQEDNDFKLNLDKVSIMLPINDKKIINILTKKVNYRNKKDYFSYELNVNYLPRLTERNNTFSKFLKQIWENEEEYEYWKLIQGKIISPSRFNNNIFIIWQHELKNMERLHWFKIMKECFRNFSMSQRKCPLEYSELHKMTCLYVDTVSNKGKLDKFINFGSLLRANRDINIIWSADTIFNTIQEQYYYKLAKNIIYIRRKEENLFEETVKNIQFDELLRDIDHVFTFCINAAYQYSIVGDNIYNSQPIRFKKEKLLLLTDDKFRYKIILEQLLMNDFDNKNNCNTLLRDFSRNINILCRQKHGLNVNFTGDILKSIINRNNYGQPLIRVKYVYRDILKKDKRVYKVMNIILKRKKCSNIQ